jgi:hypothetical protein
VMRTWSASRSIGALRSRGLPNIELYRIGGAPDLCSDGHRPLTTRCLVSI